MGGTVGQQTIDIGRGRVLTCREYGASDGSPVVYCHGGFMSGLDAAPWDDAARVAGVRVVAPARPGLDGSTPSPGRTTVDWADDVRSLLDALGIERASVLGWSMGGQYALACAARLADRITRSVVVAGALPITDTDTLHQLSTIDVRLTEQSQHRPWVARLAFGAMAQLAKRAPKQWTKTITKDLPDGEAAVVRALSDPGLGRAAATGLSSTHGMVEEYLAWARPWGFAPSDVSVPTTIWQGADDTLVPKHWAGQLGAQIPGARLSLHEHAGHFVAYAHQAEVLSDLVRTERSS